MRRQDWPARLTEFIREYELTPFEWGKHDCVTFAADVALAITDRDPMAEFRGSYSDEAGAIAEMGPGGLLGKLSSVLGEQIPVLRAQRGDVMLLTINGKDTTAVCVGDMVVSKMDCPRLVFAPFDRCHAAWKVG